MKKQISVSLPTDSDGFLSQECPVCKRRFKVKFGEGSEKPVAYCPHCGHGGERCWWTTQQAQYFAGTAGREVVGPMLDDMARKINRTSRPGSSVKLSVTVKHSPRPRIPREPEEPWSIVEFACCGERVKLESACQDVHCIICGESIVA